jgi:glycosyltransferase involved in cell wall biosynthesis
LRGRRIAYGVRLDAIAEYIESHDQEAVRRQLGFVPEDRVVLCMGVIQERKAQLALVAAFGRLFRTFPHAKLVLVGDHPTPYSAAIHQYVSDVGTGSAIRIENIVPDIYRWYRAADVMISASDIESLPRSVLEAMAFGLPTMAADVFGLSEVITDGVNGWLFEARNGAALTGGLRRILALSPAELAEVSAQCQRDSAAHDGQGYADEYLALFRELSRVG